MYQQQQRTAASEEYDCGRATELISNGRLFGRFYRTVPLALAEATLRTWDQS